jgi:hypothetical protein
MERRKLDKAKNPTTNPQTTASDPTHKKPNLMVDTALTAAMDLLNSLKLTLEPAHFAQLNRLIRDNDTSPIKGKAQWYMTREIFPTYPDPSITSNINRVFNLVRFVKANTGPSAGGTITATITGAAIRSANLLSSQLIASFTDRVAVKNLRATTKQDR